MALRRLSRGWLVLAAICALIGLYALGTSMTWFVSFVGAPESAWVAWVAAGAVLGSIAFIVAVPVLLSWADPPRWAKIVLPVVFGVLAVVAAVGMWLIAVTIFVCDFQCRPVDTWKLLPTLICGAALCGLGPATAALLDRDDRGQLLWPITVVFMVLGFAVGMYQWIEGQLY